MADEAKRAPGDEAEAKSFPCSSDSSSSSSSEEEEEDDDDFGGGGALATSFAAMDGGVRTGRRGSVMAAPLEVAPSWSPPEFRKTAEERAAIEAALRLNILFERLGDEEMAVMVGAMQAQSFEPATSIIRQGEDGDLFYILEEGVCDIFVEGVGRVMQVVGGDARAFVARRLAPASVAACFVNHPEPPERTGGAGDSEGAHLYTVAFLRRLARATTLSGAQGGARRVACQHRQ